MFRLLRAAARQRPETPPAPDLLPVRSGAELLNQPAARGLAGRIDRLTGLGQAHHDCLIRPALERYAQFVQELPASEVHHHAARGGMLIHGLEVAAGALTLRQGRLLPPGAEPEAQAGKQHIWTYAVFTAALLHDLGKPAADQRITLHDTGGRFLRQWDPLNGPINRAAWYRVAFQSVRRHGFHARLTPLLVQHILPPDGLAWLGREPEALAAWLAALTGDWDGAGVIGDIIRQADGESVARNLGAAAGPALAAGATPLHEKLITALRHLIHCGALPLNRDGAAGWLVGEDLWLVSKRVVDALREHLQAEGHEGIPTRNDRLFDVLQEHNLVQCSQDNKAIWRCSVSGEGWSHELTLLRMRPTLVWADPARRPGEFTGAITPLATPGGSAGTAAPAHTSTADTPARPAPAHGVATGYTHAPPATAGECEHSPAPDQGRDAGTCFLEWLREGLTSGQLCHNEVTARVHVVPDGILLVSPGIFRDFSRDNPQFEWQYTQKRFQKLKLHLKTAKGTNIHRYQVTGDNKHSRIHGLLIPDPVIIFGENPVPEANPHLLPVSELK